jgi:hypothetical protein
VAAVVLDGRGDGHFPEMWPKEKIGGSGKLVAVSGREVAMKGPKSHKCGRRKFVKHRKFNNTEAAKNAQYHSAYPAKMLSFTFLRDIAYKKIPVPEIRVNFRDSNSCP